MSAEKPPSKFRVLLAVNWWRIRHKRTPILYLPTGTSSAHSCPLVRAMGVFSVVPCGGRDDLAYYRAEDGGEELPLPALLNTFAVAHDDGLYPELIT